MNESAATNEIAFLSLSGLARGLVMIVTSRLRRSSSIRRLLGKQREGSGRIRKRAARVNWPGEE